MSNYQPITADKNGRVYAKLSELHAGDEVDLDNGFTCASGRKIIGGEPGALFFECADGRHYLSGQADDGEHLVGVYRADPQPDEYLEGIAARDRETIAPVRQYSVANEVVTALMMSGMIISRAAGRMEGLWWSKARTLHVGARNELRDAIEKARRALDAYEANLDDVNRLIDPL